MKKYPLQPEVRKFTPPKVAKLTPTKPIAGSSSNAQKTTLPNTPGRQAAQAKYNSKPEQVLRREGRNKARAIMVKKGLAKKGDGMDVDHKNGNTLDENPNNIRVETAAVNRHYNRRSSRTKAA